MRDDYMSSENFQKSEQTNKETQLTETVIIGGMRAQMKHGRYHFTNQSRTRLNSAISKEIKQRPHMKLSQVVELSSDTDALGNWQQRPVGILLVFEKRNDSLDSIKQDIADLQSNIQRILEKLDGWR